MLLSYVIAKCPVIFLWNKLILLWVTSKLPTGGPCIFLHPHHCLSLSHSGSDTLNSSWFPALAESRLLYVSFHPFGAVILVTFLPNQFTSCFHDSSSRKCPSFQTRLVLPAFCIPRVDCTMCLNSLRVSMCTPLYASVRWLLIRLISTDASVVFCPASSPSFTSAPDTWEMLSKLVEWTEKKKSTFCVSTFGNLSGKNSFITVFIWEYLLKLL